MEPLRTFTAASIQFGSRVGHKDENIADLDALIREAAARGARLIVTPEMGTVSTFWRDRAEVAPFVEPVTGPTVAHYTDLARELDVVLLVGFAEVDPQTGIYYNSAVLMGPDGLLAHHRKVHGYDAEALWAGEGNLGFPVVDTPLGRIGTMICMDANYPESSRLIALEGAEIIVVPANWTAEVCPAPLWITRAYENQAWLLCASRSGAQRGFAFSGGSCLLEPDGTIQSFVDDGDGIALGTIDLDDPRMRHPTFDPAIDLVRDRRPELYQILGLHRYLFSFPHAAKLVEQDGLPNADRAAVAVVEPETGATPDECERLLRQAAASGAQLAVLPEYAFTQPPTDAAGAAEAADAAGEIEARVEGLCAELGIFTVFGTLERADGGLFPTVLLVGPEGIVARYRSTLLSATERAWATPGDELVWADTPLGRVGLCSGTDLLMPEVVRCLALEGCDVVCAPGALSGPRPIARPATAVPLPANQRPLADDPRHWVLPRVRAGENNVYLAFANWQGPDGFMGYSGIYGPVAFTYPWDEETVDATASAGTRIACKVIDLATGSDQWPDNPVRAKPVLAHRLPVLYTELLVTGRS